MSPENKNKFLKGFFLLALLIPIQKLVAQNKLIPLPANVIWDDKPATVWMKEAYPIGNGRIGGMIFGGVNQEHIQFNDNTLWTGDENNRGAYQAFGDIFIDFDNAGDFTGYKRKLDIDKAVHQVSYLQNGVQYNRAYFCSFPDKVMVLRFTASKKGTYSGILSLKDEHGAQITANGTTVQFAGSLPNGMTYQATALVKLENGSSSILTDNNGASKLKINKADAITILFTAATNFSNKREQNWKGQEPGVKIKQILARVAVKPYAVLLNDHIRDYQKLFNRVSISLANTTVAQNALTTKQRIIDYKAQPDHGLETLQYQFGRYLLISSSRKGGLPANLQGLWNDTNDPAWGSDYHSNINIQMNYWLAEPTNLSECAFPYLDYINSIREVAKIHTQKEYGNVRGWTVRTENNSFGGDSYKWNVPGSAWYAQALWDHYAFTKDKAYLKNFAYPIIKEISEFWDDHLKRRDDGTLVSPNGWSPEHGPTEDGVSHDQQIIYDLFTNYIEAAEILGIDPVYKNHIADLKAHLLKPKIGKWGQLQEWETDRDDPTDKHRHVSHLFAVYPGRQISTITTPELAKAATVSLLARGDASTGWSMAWKMNFWARLQDGDHAYTILKNFINLAGAEGTNYNEGGGIYSNLLCAHPPFQIDGNFGYTAGVTEMLVQSQTGEIQLLPALPTSWDSGIVKGIKTRGDFEITELQWKNGKVSKLVIKSPLGGKCSLRSASALKANFVFSKISTTNNFSYLFNTQPGKSYTFTSNL